MTTIARHWKPTHDSTRLLAHEAVAAALDARTLDWRGGPLQRASLQPSRA
jgi:hypothetical protein